MCCISGSWSVKIEQSDHIARNPGMRRTRFHNIKVPFLSKSHHLRKANKKTSHYSAFSGPIITNDYGNKRHVIGCIPKCKVDITLRNEWQMEVKGRICS